MDLIVGVIPFHFPDLTIKDRSLSQKSKVFERNHSNLMVNRTNLAINLFIYLNQTGPVGLDETNENCSGRYYHGFEKVSTDLNNNFEATSKCFPKESFTSINGPASGSSDKLKERMAA